MDSQTPFCSQPAFASPTLATAGTVLPHDDTQSTQLARQASHLTLSTQMPWPTTQAEGVSPVTTTPAEPPNPAPKRRRASSACCVANDHTSPPPPRPRQASAATGPLLPPLPATAPSTSTPAAAAGAQPAPLISPPRPPCGHSSEGPEGGDGQELDLGGAAYPQAMDWHPHVLAGDDELGVSCTPTPGLRYGDHPLLPPERDARVTLVDLPNEVLLYVLSFLDVSDLLAISRTSHQLRSLALAPIVHRLRLRHAREVLPPLLTSPSRPTLTELIQRSIFLTKTTVVSRRLGRSLTAIRLSRRLAARPEPEALVARSVLPPECVPFGSVAPGLVAKRRAVEREQVRDGMRRWVGAVWERRWREKAEDRRRWQERSGVGRVWRLRRFWEGVGKGEIEAG
ncbi:F-box domain-containing protein [Diaporthe helianthi]|uniref:F-box domain-containing protein n=1 Tax=Diaporthe helianthi TaxID=158607 RepID=A0A2P5HIS2_DIAHE|nr:F-box domain-containing protein [Diaporthe helianthi]